MNTITILTQGTIIILWTLFLLFGVIGGLSVITNGIILLVLAYLYFAIDSKSFNIITIIKNNL